VTDSVTFFLGLRFGDFGLSISTRRSDIYAIFY
jgi:hypothetical protein